MAPEDRSDDTPAAKVAQMSRWSLLYSDALPIRVEFIANITVAL
jgi:hypothetical protein